MQRQAGRVSGGIILGGPRHWGRSKRTPFHRPCETASADQSSVVHTYSRGRVVFPRRLFSSRCCRWLSALELTVSDRLQWLGHAGGQATSGGCQGTADVANDHGGGGTRIPVCRRRTFASSGRTTAPVRPDGALPTLSCPSKFPEAAGRSSLVAARFASRKPTLVASSSRP
jgi:hypothetical protein